MGKYFFMKPVLELISVGHFFRKAFAVFLQILAVVVAIAGLVSWITVWKSVAGQDFSLILGIIIFQLFFVIAVYMVVHTMFIRAGDISALPDSDYTVIPIVSISLKLIGEIYACFVAAVSVGGGIAMWLMKSDAFFMIKRSAPFIPSFGGGEGFFGGLLFIVGGLFAALIVLVFFYFLAEAVIVMVEIAENTKITRQVAEKYNKK
jgi:hypothetical protein